MKTVALEWTPFFEGSIVPKQEQSNINFLAAGAGLGIAEALHPFKLIIAECSDPVCFVGGAIGLYRVATGDREGGFKQVLNAAIAQIGFFVWPKIQLAIRMNLGV